MALDDLEMTLTLKGVLGMEGLATRSFEVRIAKLAVIASRTARKPERRDARAPSQGTQCAPQQAHSQAPLSRCLWLHLPPIPETPCDRHVDQQRHFLSHHI